MKDHIGTEKVVHGQQWGALHNGYFADSTIARPLLNAAIDVLTHSPADVVVDLGGGTGFLLSQLAAYDICHALKLKNVDCSEEQLAVTDAAGIAPVHKSLEDFKRSDVAAAGQRLFLIMRSVLHYVGETGLRPLLRHLRAQTKEGEFFVHQTASFDNEDDAACLNALYHYMHTSKCYPLTNELTQALTDSGWRVTNTMAAPTLLLTSDDLALRYALDATALAHIRDKMAKEFGAKNRVFRLTPSGFHACLPYRIFTCVASLSSLDNPFIVV
ncbi:MAG TPA: hypothetical protein DEQ20_09915 [Desulfobulbaceae bacterium]|nr:hypothetical protein [Desulfobulbaceae bacterium]